jgi:diguanylate cyclase (GGDEF)-like protein
LAISSQNHNLGYLISYKKDANIAVFDTIFWENVLLSNVLILLILGFIAYMLHTKEQFEKMAITDKLTGLYNRYKFYSVAQQELNRSKRHKHPFSLIIFDIDHFKKINDTYGHDVGDRVLKTVAKLVRKNVRKYDYVFRWGGEEFIILAPETDINGALKLAEKIRTIIASHHFAKIGHVTISAGIAQFVEDIDKGIDSIVKRADNALYLAKHEGRNRSRIAL